MIIEDRIRLVLGHLMLENIALEHYVDAMWKKIQKLEAERKPSSQEAAPASPEV